MAVLMIYPLQPQTRRALPIQCHVVGYQIQREHLHQSIWPGAVQLPAIREVLAPYPVLWMHFLPPSHQQEA